MKIITHRFPSLILGLLLIVSMFFTTQPHQAQAASVAENVKGRILLQVQQNGEAWYVNPDTLLRHYMGRPKDAFELMRSQGLGITNADIAKIPIGLQSLSGTDTDGDGLSDIFEDAIGSDKTKSDTDSDGFSDYQEVQNGFNTTGIDPLIIDNTLVNRLKGKILLQVEQNGEAWYLSPVDSKRYFLGRPHDAFSIMRNLGLGITDQDLEQVGIGVDISDWLTYRNEELGFEMNYPNDWVIEENVNYPFTTLLIRRDFQADKRDMLLTINPVNPGRESVFDFGVKSACEIKIINFASRNTKECISELLSGVSRSVRITDRTGINWEKNNEINYFIRGEYKELVPVYDQILSTFRFINDTSDWLTYRSEEYGFEVKHPRDLEFSENMALSSN